MKKVLIIISIVFSSCVICRDARSGQIPDIAGVAGAQFLRLDVGARASAMGGGTYCAVPGDAFAVFYNPACLAGLKAFELGCQYNLWYENIASESAVAAMRLKSGSVIGLAGTYLHMDDMTGTDENKQSIADFTAFDIAGMASYARKLGKVNNGTDGVYAGLNLKFIYQAIEVETASGIAGDIGMLVKAGAFSAGVSLQNFGTKLKFIETAYPLPLTLRSGISYAAAGENKMVVAAAINVVSFGSIDLSAGGEYVMKDLFAVRAGYATGNGLMTGWTAGAGIKTGGITLDYAWVPGSLGNSQRFSLNMKF